MARGSDEYVVVPEGWLSRGDAFVRGDGQQLAVFGGIPGERARVRIVERAGHQARARFVKAVGAPSPERVEPGCDRFVPCGRCTWMHLSEAGRARHRVAVLADAFRSDAFGGPVEVDAPVALAPEAAAHAVELVAGRSDEGHLRVGVPGRDGRRVVPIPECLLATESLKTLMKGVAHHARALEIWPWEGGRGSLRGLFARQSSTTGELLVTYVFARATPFASQLAEAVASQNPAIAGAFARWHDEPGAMLAPSAALTEAEVSLVYGRAFVDEQVDGLRIRLGALDPFPTCVAVGVRQWQDTVALLAPQKGDAVVDLGCGSGARTLLLARKSGWALGIDPREGVLRRARENAAFNGVSAEFALGPLGETIADAQSRLEGRRPLVVADPGPKGLDPEARAAIAAVAPRRVVLVSANPKALVKDAEALVGAGLRLTRVVPYESAPWAHGGETLAVLESLDATPPSMRAPRRRTVRG